MTVYGTGVPETQSAEVNHTFLGLEPGWPVMTNSANEYGPATLVDFDPSFPGKELVFEDENGTLGHGILGYHGDGSPMTFTPTSVASRGEFPPAFADIDGDGELETVLAGGGRVAAVNRDGSFVPGFPAVFPTLPIYEEPPTTGCPSGRCPGHYNSFANVTVADLDLDGDLEIVVPVGISSYVGTVTLGRVLVFDHQGNGLIRAIDPEGYHYPTDMTQDAWVAGQASVADLDGNGDLEILSMTDLGVLYAFHHDGTAVAGWPNWVRNFYYVPDPPAVADLNGDGKDEVIVAAADLWSVYVWNGDGTLWGQSPYGTSGAPSMLAVADVDRDGVQEIVTRTNRYLHVLHRSGVPVESFPMRNFLGGYSGNWPLAVEDVNGAPGLEVIWADTIANAVQAASAAGQHIVENFPFFFHGWTPNWPLIGDATGDGKLDLLTESTVWPGVSYLFSLDRETPTNVSSWPIPLHDPALTSRAPCPECSPAEPRPYDSRTISCDAIPTTPACDVNAASQGICSSFFCRPDCTCTPYRDVFDGWPRLTAAPWAHSMVTTADLESDGSPEVFFNRLAFRANGTRVEAFDFVYDDFGENYNWQTFPSIGNVDGDPELEVASTYSWREQGTYVRHGGFSLTDHEGKQLPGWPIEIDGVPASVQLGTTLMANVDPATPALEIIGWTYRYVNQIPQTTVHVWNAAGQELTGFPKVLERGFLPLDVSPVSSGLSAGDVDGDGSAELVFSFNDAWAGSSYNGARVVAVDGDGSVLWEFSRTIDFQEQFTVPVLGEVSPENPGLETLVARDFWDDLSETENGDVYVLNGRGELLSGWPKTFPENGGIVSSMTKPILAEMDGDGKLEVIVGSSIAGGTGEIFVFDDDGALKPGWPVNPYYFGQQSGHYLVYEECQLTASDIDGDGKSEIVICGGDGDGKLTILNEDATLVAGWPFWVTEKLQSPPAVADLNGDGTLEIVQSGVEAALYAFTTGERSQIRSGDWPVGTYDATLANASRFSAQNATLFLDTFDDGDDTGWQKVGDWTVQSDGESSPYYRMGTPSTFAQNAWVSGRTFEGDHQIIARVKRTTGTGFVGLDGAYASDEATYRFLYAPNSNALFLYRGNFLLHMERPSRTLDLTQWHQLQLLVLETNNNTKTLVGRIWPESGNENDGVEIRATDDNPLPAGTIGLRCYGNNTTCRFDDVRVATLPPPAPPGGGGQSPVFLKEQAPFDAGTMN